MVANHCCHRTEAERRHRLKSQTFNTGTAFSCAVSDGIDIKELFLIFYAAHAHPPILRLLFIREEQF
jgi:hypothetical protein